MKKSVILFLILCGLAIAIIIPLRSHKTPAPAPVAEVAPAAAKPQAVEAPQPTPPVAETVSAATPAPAATEAKVDPAVVAVRKAVDALLAAKSGKEKHELFQELVKSGQLEAAIAELKQRAADNPNDAGIPTTLGEAYLNQLRAMRAAGNTDVNDMGILAMQADKSFNAALKLDPNNWEANFVKASSMYYWPANPERDADVVQRLSGLIDQQETQPSRPEYVQTYIVLGNQYQKMGQPDKALATWRLGLQKFPGNADLTRKVNGQ